jgi:hypothetical protein
MLSVFSAHQVSAQAETTTAEHWSIGLSGGYVHNSLSPQSGHRAFTRYEGAQGFSVGLPVQYAWNDWFALQAEPSFIQKGYKQQRSVAYEAVHSRWRNSFIELPLMARFSFGGERLRGFLNTGAFAGFWLDSHIKGQSMTFMEDYADPERIFYYAFDEQVPFDTRRDNRLEAGLLAGIGLQYRFAGYTFFVEVRYYYGLTDLQNDYMLNQVPRYNDTWLLQAGLLFDLTYLINGRR